MVNVPLITLPQSSNPEDFNPTRSTSGKRFDDQIVADLCG